MTMSYGDRGRAAPLNHSVYELYCKSLGLNDADFLNLKNRGLHPETISTCGYASKLANNNGRTIEAIGKTRQDYDLKGVPGFYTNDKTGHWTQSGITGITIPVRDINGHISSLLIRNAKPTERNGKVINKYVAFSSAGKTDGAKVWQTTHCPIVKGSAKDTCGVTARITEGVLKADVATAMDDIFCLGMQGLNFQPDLQGITEELEISTLHIALDSGEDDNIDIIRAKGNLAKLCDDIGIDYKFELWDPKYGKGIDDVLAAGHKDKIRIATQEEVDEILEKAHAKNPNNGEFVYVVSMSRFVSTVTNQILKKSQFMDKFQFEKPEVVNLLISQGFPQVDTITYWPGKEQFLIENGQTVLNEWEKPDVMPAQGDVSVFSNHLQYILGDESSILLNWLAFQKQYPGEKILWMPVIIGGQGIGKSYFGQAIVKLFGQGNVKFPMNEQLDEKYNDWQRKAQVVIIEELMANGQIKLMNRLKPLITESQTQIRIMNNDAFPYPNRFNMIGFTNYNSALKLETDDRRYCILKSSAEPRDEAYYKLLWSWLDDPKNIQALLHMLLNRDLTKFNPKARAPQTTAKSQMIKDSRSRLEEWIEECIADDEWPFDSDLVSIRHLKSERVCPRALQGISDNKWADALERAGAIKYPKPIMLSSGSRARLWITNRHDMMLNLKVDEIKAQYEKWLQSKHPGGNPLEDRKPM